MIGTAKQAGQTSRDVARKIASQMTREPLEILKTAKEQTVGGVRPPETQPQPLTISQDVPKPNTETPQVKMMNSRRMEALNRELTEIRKNDLVKDIQRRISEGEDVPLEDYMELSMEQKQVLNAQMEAYRAQALRVHNQNISEVPSVSSKPSRRFGAGQKQEAEKQQTRVEKPVPPSG